MKPAIIDALRKYNIRTLAISVYTRESWRQLCAVADDRDDLATFEEQEKKVARLTREFEAQGYRVEPVVLDIDELVRWCRQEGRRVDQSGRAAFGAHLAVLRDLPAEGEA